MASIFREHLRLCKRHVLWRGEISSLSPLKRYQGRSPSTKLGLVAPCVFVERPRRWWRCQGRTHRWRAHVEKLRRAVLWYLWWDLWPKCTAMLVHRSRLFVAPARARSKRLRRIKSTRMISDLPGVPRWRRRCRVGPASAASCVTLDSKCPWGHLMRWASLIQCGRRKILRIRRGEFRRSRKR